MKRIELKLQSCKSTLFISILVGLGYIFLTRCIVNESQSSDNNQTINNRKPPVKIATSTSSEESDEPPPLPNKIRESREDHYKWFSGRLMQNIREREKKNGLQPIENLPDSLSEIRLWYFPPFEKIKGIVFTSSDKSDSLILINENLKEEIRLNKETLDRLRKVLRQSKIEKLKDTKSIDYNPSPDESYIVYQIKFGRKVNFKIYPAGVGANVKPTEPSDLCEAAKLCGELSELLSLGFNDCKCSWTKEVR